MLTPRQAVLETNLAFYEAFFARDLHAMDRLWSATNPIACVHPGWQAVHGRGPVMASWRAILGSPSAPLVRCREAQATLIDQVAVVTCVEEIGQGRLVATNVFAFEDGLWKMVHHQAAPFTERVVPDDAPPPDSLN